MTIRLRLTALYSTLLLGAGAVLLAGTYLFVAHSPWPGQPDRPEVPTVDLPGGPTVEEPAAPAVPDALADASADRRAEDLRRLLAGSLVALGAMAVVSTGVGWYVAGRVLAPLATMTARTRQITAENLHERLRPTGPDDELTTLARTLDDLLDRLDAALESQRRFVANASHELRTPLTVQRTLVEVALADPDADVDALRTTCHEVLGNVEDQQRTIDALLALARSQRPVERSTPTDLADLTADALEGGRLRAGERRLWVTARVDPAPVAGDVDLLRRMVANLVDNAIRHNVDGGWVEVATGRDERGRARLQVANGGEPLDEADIPHLVEPFRRHRAGRARDPGDDGLGLGLSIVDAVVRSHRGHLDARALPGGGLGVDVRLPPHPAGDADEPSGRG
jgi:signal transduction histidine kinase